MLSRRSLMTTLPAVPALFAGASKAQASATALTAAGGVLGRGTYQVETDLTVTGDLMLLPGASIVVAAGRTLTIHGSFLAPISQVFSGGGRIDMTGSRAPAGVPEWWGARTGDGAYDNLAALGACLESHPVMQLQCADYFIAGTWQIGTSNRTIKGSGKNWRGPNTATRIIVSRAKAGTADAVLIGRDRDPGAIDKYVFNVRLSDVDIVRDGVVTPPQPGRGHEGAAGLRLQYCVEIRIEDVSTDNHTIGVYIGGVVHSFVRRCNSGRAVPGTRPDGDVYWGLYLDGDVAGGFAGGNASVYLEDCTVGGPGNGSSIDSIAAYLKGGFADTFLINLESAGCKTGIRIEGVGRLPTSRRKSGNGDVHIIMPILDQVVKGIELLNLSDYALIDIVSPYIATAASAFACIHAQDCGGNITLTGGQLIGWGNSDSGGSAGGIRSSRTEGLKTLGTKLLGCRRPVELDGCANFDLDVMVNNPDQVTGSAAILLDRCARVAVKPWVKGKAGAFAAGVELRGDANSRVAIDCTGIDPACITGGAAKKLVIDGSGVTKTGAKDGHFITGIMD